MTILPILLNHRRIVIAQMQNIVYGQYLSVVVGPEAMKTYRLTLQSQSTYNVQTNPSINNAFATAAYRFGHSMIRDLVNMINSVTGAKSNYRLQDNFFDVTVYVKQMEDILNGMTNQRAETMDMNVVTDVTDHLFGNNGRPSDLIARNIQRGRDHGLPGYNDWREFCRLGKACSWDQGRGSTSLITGARFTN
jgi:peroxidase